MGNSVTVEQDMRAADYMAEKKISVHDAFEMVLEWNGLENIKQLSPFIG